MQLISHLKGHKASILCLETAQNAPLGGAVLASGSEDRTCRIWDLRTEKAAKAIRGLENEVASICFPTKPSSPHLYLAVGKKVHVYDLRSPDLILSQSTRSYEFSQDELNQITINDKDKYLATADDNGQVKVVDLETHQLYKQFRTKHDNICMAVRFRPKKPWDLFSGGMDNNLIQWDFSRGVPTVVWDMAAPSGLTPGAQVFNPPFVYTIAASDDGHVMGVGLGDGSIKVLTTTASGAGKGPGKKGGKGWTEWRLDSGHGCAVVKVSFTPTPTNHLLSASTDATVCLWDLSQGISPVSPTTVFPAYTSLRKCNTLATTEQRMYVAGVGRRMGEEGVIAVYEAGW